MHGQDRISLFAEKELDDSGKQTLADNKAPEIEYRNVTFAYDKKDVLKDVSFKADKGTMTALVGPSRGGKSTITSSLQSGNCSRSCSSVSQIFFLFSMQRSV